VIISSVTTLVMIIFMPYWGKRIDRFGNIKVLKIASVLLPLVPILWLVSSNVYYLCFAQIISGFAWAGFNLVTSIFIYDAAPVENRVRYLALHYGTSWGGIALGAFLGGVITPILPTIKQSNLLTMFLISGVARLLIILIFLPRISEVRTVPKVSTKEFLFRGVNLTELKHLPYQTVKNIVKNRRNRRQ
ncbi:MAG: MFS transporter, partial [Dehalococcoidales bacterium]|nr:MFS transporter [Dehalococcoidales bacterium]